MTFNLKDGNIKTMLYSRKFIIPQNTPRSAPIKTSFTIGEKVITKIEVMMDVVATRTNVGIKISGGKPGLKSFNFPVNADDWIWMNEIWMGRIEFPEANFPIDVIGFNEDDTNDHIVIISIHTQ